MIELTVVNRPVSLREETSILCLAMYLYRVPAERNSLFTGYIVTTLRATKPVAYPFMEG